MKQTFILFFFFFFVKCRKAQERYDSLLLWYFYLQQIWKGHCQVIFLTCSDFEVYNSGCLA